MRKSFVLYLFLNVLVFASYGQVEDIIVDDFEGTNKNWAQIDPGWVTLDVVDNPLKDDINSSNKVMKVVRKAGTATYAGLILRNQTPVPFGMTKEHYRYAHVKVLKTSNGRISFKLENNGDNGSFTNSQEYTPDGQWQKIVFDLGGAGKNYDDFFIMPDQTAEPAQDIEVFIDEIVFKTDPDPKDPGEEINEGTYKLIWSDEFDGVQLDESIWGYQMGRGENRNWAWGNNEQQFYTSQSTNNNIIVEDGMLTIRAKRESYTAFNPSWSAQGEMQSADFTSARILTRGNFSTKYGRIEARIALPVEPGLWPAFWMMPEYSVYGGWPRSGEIDIMEAKGRLPNRYGGAIHFGNSWPENSHISSGDYYFPNGGSIEDFHVYAVEWEYGIIKWLCDDVVIGTQTAGWFSPGQPFPAPFDQEFHIILNLAVGGNFDGNVMPSANWTSGDMKVDYVRVYQKSLDTGIENIKNKEFTLIPVSENEWAIDIPDSSLTVTVFSLSGQKQLSTTVSKNETINVSSLSKGVYIVSATDGTNVYSQKIIIK